MGVASGVATMDLGVCPRMADPPEPTMRPGTGGLPEGWSLGEALGFTGKAAAIEVGPGYVVDEDWSVPPARRRLRAAYEYLMMMAKRAYPAPTERGDKTTSARLDDVHAEAANAVLLAASAIRDLMEAQGYDARELDTPRPFTGEDHPDLPAPRPEQYRSTLSDVTLGGDASAEPEQ